MWLRQLSSNPKPGERQRKPPLNESGPGPEMASGRVERRFAAGHPRPLPIHRPPEATRRPSKALVFGRRPDTGPAAALNANHYTRAAEVGAGFTGVDSGGTLSVAERGGLAPHPSELAMLGPLTDHPVLNRRSALAALHAPALNDTPATQRGRPSGRRCRSPGHTGRATDLVTTDP